MTVLLTVCPYCKSNMMLMSTRESEGSCLACKRAKTFTPEEVSEAETRRDRLFEKYGSSMQIAYENGDHETMSKIAEDVALEGVSSWYAWFCIGWSHLHKGMTAMAFEDFKLAVAFLEEEDFDEFHELVTDEVLGSLKESILAKKPWGDESTSLCAFTATLSGRFDPLMECDFLDGLIFLMADICEDLTECAQFIALIREVVSLATDYMSASTYVRDHITMMEDAVSTLEIAEKGMIPLMKDGTVPEPIAKAWSKEFASFFRLFSETESRYTNLYSDNELTDLGDYWVYVGDFDTMFDKFQDALEYHVAYMRSLGRNKGDLKKRNKAIEEYCEMYIRPLEEGLVYDDVEDVDDVENVDDGSVRCLQCGGRVVPDETGRVVCECGFKSRLTTECYDTLPTDLQSLKGMALEAYGEKDASLLNNIGEKIVDLFPDEPFGQFVLGCSCAFDGELGEAMMLFAESAGRVEDPVAEDLYPMILDAITDAMSKASGDQVAAIVVVPPLREATLGMCESLCRDLLVRMLSVEATSPEQAMVMLMIDYSLFNTEIMAENDIRTQAEACSAAVDALTHLEEELPKVEDDALGLKDEIKNSLMSTRDTLRYFVSESKAALSGMSEEEIAKIVSHWESVGDMEDMKSGLLDGLCYDTDLVYNPNSKGMKKARSLVKKYVKAYISQGRA